MARSTRPLVPLPAFVVGVLPSGSAKWDRSSPSIPQVGAMPRAIVQYEHCLEGQPLACPCVARSASMASSPGIVIVGPQQIWSTQQHHEVGPQHIRSMQQHREVEVGPKQIQSMQHRERKERRQAEAAVADAASVAVVTAVRALSAAISEPSQPGDLRLHIAGECRSAAGRWRCQKSTQGAR